jgi:hypothetical protein
LGAIIFDLLPTSRCVVKRGVHKRAQNLRSRIGGVDPSNVHIDAVRADEKLTAFVELESAIRHVTTL